MRAAEDRNPNPAPRGDLVRSAQALVSKREDLRALLSHLDFEPLGHSAFVWTEEASPVRGARVGPFWLLSKPRGSGAPASLRVIINTNKRYLDATGKETSTPTGASEVEQSVESVQIIPLEPPDPSLLGSWRLASSRGPGSVLLSSARWTFELSRRFHATQVSGDGRPVDFEGYFLNDGGKLTLGQVDSGTFQVFHYEVSGKALKVSGRDEKGELALEWTFARE